MINNLQSTSMCDIKYKIVFLGNMSVGKSSIIQRFITGRFQDGRQDTIGIDFLSKNVQHNHHIYRLLLWDTAGQQKFRSLIPAYLRDAHCAVIVYDITNQDSFDGVKNWIQMFNNYKRHDAIIIIVGNKTDLKDRKVNQQIAFDFAIKGHVGYSQVSAKKGQGIQMLFQSIIANILITKQLQEQPKNDIIDPPNSTQRLERIDRNSGSRDKISVGKINREAVVRVVQIKKPIRFSCCSI